MKPVFDTNILIDYLNGVRQAADEFERFPEAVISAVTWAEVMAGAAEPEEKTLRAFLHRFRLVPVDREVAGAAAMLRRTFRIKLPDAIIWATARTQDAMLLTRNDRDFPVSEPDIRVPYRL